MNNALPAGPPDEPERPPSWWGGAGGGREVLTVAMPLVVSSLSWTIMTFVDRMFLNNWSGEAMAAAFVGSIVWFAVLCLPLGVCAYTSTFVAQYHGAGHHERIGPAVWQGVWVALATTPFVLLPILFAAGLFRAAGHSPSEVALESTYFTILCGASPAMLLAQSLSSFYSGRGKTSVVMTVDTAFALLNALLDWWWIFGLTVVWGESRVEVFPAWGVAGAAWATVVSTWLKAATYLALFLAPRFRGAFATHRAAFDRPLFSRMLSFGVPAGVQMLLDVLGFTVFVMLVGRLGSVENEATSLTFSVGSLAFMPVCGLGLAASILVGQHLGENRDRAAARATWTALHVSWGYMAAVSILLVCFPELLLTGFFAAEPRSGDPATRVAVEETARVLLRFVAAYNFLDAMAIVFVSALKGAGDTRFILLTSLVMALMLGLATWLSVAVFQSGIYACWGVVSAWIAVLGVTFLLRFLHGAWRSMRVIEPQLAAIDPSGQM